MFRHWELAFLRGNGSLLSFRSPRRCERPFHLSEEAGTNFQVAPFSRRRRKRCSITGATASQESAFKSVLRGGGVWQSRRGKKKKAEKKSFVSVHQHANGSNRVRARDLPDRGRASAKRNKKGIWKKPNEQWRWEGGAVKTAKAAPGSQDAGGQ